MKKVFSLSFLAISLLSTYCLSAEKGKTVTEKPVKTESGLQYIDQEIGSGETPKAGQRIAVHYSGRLEDGTEFDSSHRRGQPIKFTLGIGQVIKGWDEGLSSMKVGGKRQLIIPAQLGYGDRGAPPVIPPKATLIFDVELVGIE
jgi:peptidylprolyl isomerase